MENKNYKGLVWLVVILIVLVVALMGFIVYREFYSDNKTNVDNTTNTTTNSVGTTEIADDENDLKTYNGVYIDESIKDDDIRNVYALVSNIGFMATGYEWNFESKTKLLFDDLSDDEKMKMVFAYLTKNEKVKYDKPTDDGDNYLISNKDFKEAWTNIFGNENIEIVNDFSKDGCSATLNEENGYSVDCYGTGREDDDETYVLMDTSKTDDKIEFTVAYYYVEHISQPTQSGEGEFISNVYYSANNNNQIICKEEQVNQHLDKLIQYKFTFAKQNTNYVFESIEKIN